LRALEHLLGHVQRLCLLAHELEDAHGVEFALAAGAALGIQRRLEKIHRGHAGDFHGILQRQEDSLGGAFFRRHRGQVFALVEDRARGDLVTGAARQRVGQRRLAGAVWPHDRMHLARAHGKGQALEDFLAVYGDVEVGDV
jgi:hypothetical protein